MSRVRVDRAGAASLRVLATLHATSFAEPWDHADIGRLLALPGGFALIALVTRGGAEYPVGFALCRAAADECEILSLAVAPGFRRLGAGTALVQACAERAVALGAAGLYLEVAADNGPGQGLYRALGFAEIGRRADYYRRANGAVAALNLRLDLSLLRAPPDGGQARLKRST